MCIPLDRPIIVAVALRFPDEGCVVQNIVGDQRLAVSHVVTLGRPPQTRLHEAWVGHQVALVLHQETAHIRLGANRHQIVEVEMEEAEGEIDAHHCNHPIPLGGVITV